MWSWAFHQNIVGSSYCTSNMTWYWILQCSAYTEHRLKLNTKKDTPMADSRFTSSQWEMALLCNNVSHWLGASLESTPHIMPSWVSYGVCIARILAEILSYNGTAMYDQCISAKPHDPLLVIVIAIGDDYRFAFFGLVTKLWLKFQGLFY